MDAQRALLDSLMGAQRNRDVEDRRRKSWKDSDVCKHFLVAFCPYVLFQGSKSHIGICDKLHLEYLKQNYMNEVSRSTRRKYERRLIQFLEDLTSRLDIRIRRTEERLTEQSTDTAEAGQEKDPAPDAGLTNDQKERLEEIKDIIRQKEKKMERCGDNGRVEEAQAILNDVEILKMEANQLRDKTKLLTNWKPYDRALKTCEVCGCFVDRVDPSRTLNHENGRTHQGYLLVRTTLEELQTREEKFEISGMDDSRKKRRKRKKRRRSRSRSRSIRVEASDSQNGEGSDWDRRRSRKQR